MVDAAKNTTNASMTVLGRLSRVRGFAAFLVLLVAAPILVGLATREAISRVALPDVGLDVDAELGVEARDGRWTGVRQRDRIVELDGVAPRDPADWTARALSGGPRPLAVTFERAGTRFTVVAASRPLVWVDRIAVFARIATALALMLMGLLVFVARPGTVTTWLMLVLSWDLGAFLLIKIGFWFDPHLVKEATVFPWGIATSVGLHLMTVFPARIEWFVVRPRRALLLYGGVVIAPFVQFFHLVTRASALATALTAIGVFVVIAVVVAQYRRVARSNDRRARSQYRALVVGFIVGLAFPALWNFFRISLDLWNSPWAAHYNALPLVVFIGVIAYAVVVHNALAIDRFTAAVVGYSLTTILVGGAFAGALIGIPLMLGSRASPTLLVTITALTFAGVAPIHRLLRRVVDRRFFRQQADAATIADALRDLVIGMQGARDDAIRTAFTGAGILQGDRIELWLLEPEVKALRLNRRYGLGDEHPEQIPLDGSLGHVLASGVSGGVRELAPRAFESAAQEDLLARELCMAAPIMLRGTVAGFLGVGRKRSGVGYTFEELSFLTIIGAQLGAVLERTESETQIDRYHLERRLGTGGMAEVFLAWQVGPGGFERKVALKRPLPHVSEDPNAVASFLDEARLAAQLVHPHVARVYDVGERSGSYFIVMECVDGPSLRQVVRAAKKRAMTIPLPVATTIMLSVLSALEYAHAARDDAGRELKLVHRDVTPRNILLNRQGQPKLVDFGIARAQFQLHVTRTGTVKGTLPYMSPEQATDRPIDHRSDLYSAAVVFYELLTGEVAFPKGPGMRRPKPASTIATDVPASIDDVIKRATEASPANRYESAADFAAAITAAIRPASAADEDAVVRFLREVSLEQMHIDPPSSETPTAQTVIERARPS
jgi:serine/threonine-protein kinase